MRLEPKGNKSMIKRKAGYTFNAVKQVAKTATYTVLYTDEQIDVTPAANTVLTLPKISDLASYGIGSKAYKITKQGTGRYSVKVITGDTVNEFFNVAGAAQDCIFISSYGDEVVIVSDPVMRQWRIIHSTLSMFLGTALASGKEGNISIETNALTGQINGIEINMSGPNGAATASSSSYTAMRVNQYIVGTEVQTGRCAFFGIYSHHATVSPFHGQMVAVSIELGDAFTEATGLGCTYNVLELSTRLAYASRASNGHAYISIRDLSTTTGADALANLFFFGGTGQAWSVPTEDTSVIFSRYYNGGAAELQTHSLKFSVGGTPYWILCTSIAPH
jgi:hypothetical protein